MIRNLSRGLIVFSFLSLALSSQATNSLEVAINEIAWMGTKNSSFDEWIELRNNTLGPINLEGWLLKAVDGTPEIKLSGIIPAQSFYLLERTDDNTVPEFLADQIYKGSLNNKGESLKLYDGFGSIIDTVNCSAGWFAGDNSSKQTMERLNSFLTGGQPANWRTSQNSRGTPKVENSLTGKTDYQEKEIKEPENQSEEERNGQKERQNGEESDGMENQPMTYPSGIVINEILPSPQGPDAENEWIEIFNQNSFKIDISNWQIVDGAGSTKNYIFPQGTVIEPKSFLVLPRTTTKITLNNSEDSLSLIQPNGEIIDSLNYKKAPQGQSYNLIGSGWVWSNILTPGSLNIIQPPVSNIKETEEQREGESKTESISLQNKKELAAVSQQNPQEKSFFLLLIALSFAIFSGVIVLFLKRRMERNKRTS